MPPFKADHESKNKYTVCQAYSSIKNKFPNTSTLDVEDISLYHDNSNNKNYYVFRFTDYIKKHDKFYVGCENVITLTWIKVDSYDGQAILMGESQERLCID